MTAVEPSARAEFARRLDALYRCAGRPTLEGVAAAARERTRAARCRHDHGAVRLQRISDWRRGVCVPARFETFLPVLLTLIDRARACGQPVPAELTDLAAWRRVWQDTGARATT